jgi:hypothetical protein
MRKRMTRAREGGWVAEEQIEFWLYPMKENIIGGIVVHENKLKTRKLKYILRTYVTRNHVFYLDLQNT